VGGRISLIVYFSACINETAALACFVQRSKHMLKKHIEVNKCFVIVYIELTKRKELKYELRCVKCSAQL
jgi:hypothetical protein